MGKAETCLGSPGEAAHIPSSERMPCIEVSMKIRRRLGVCPLNESLHSTRNEALRLA